MVNLPPTVRVFLATQPVDGRKGMDSLAALVRNYLGEDPLSGHLFVFFSKRCNRARILYWDRDGYALWTKRLERGKFLVRFSADERLEARSLESGELSLILAGIELAGSRRLPRWEPDS